MPSSSSRGFTLVEVLVATAIVVTVAGGTAQLIGIAIRHEVIARQQLAMSAAASAKIDEIVATLAGGPPPSVAGGALDQDIAGYTDVVDSSGTPFRRRWRIAPLAAYSATAVVVVMRVTPLVSLSAPDLEIATIADAGGA